MPFLNKEFIFEIKTEGLNSALIRNIRHTLKHTVHIKNLNNIPLATHFDYTL
jgi:hypothetical protein